MKVRKEIIVEPSFILKRFDLSYTPDANPDVDEVIRYNILGCDHPRRYRPPYLGDAWACLVCWEVCPAPVDGEGTFIEEKKVWEATT